MSFQAISVGVHGELVYDGEVELRIDRQGKGEPGHSVVSLLFVCLSSYHYASVRTFLCNRG